MQSWGTYSVSVALVFGLMAIVLFAGRVVYTPLHSLPKGFYWREQGQREPQRGDVVVIDSPRSWRPFLPANFPTTHIMKQLVAVGGDIVCWDSQGMHLTRPGGADLQGAQRYIFHPDIQTRWHQHIFCPTLGEHEIVLIGTDPRSMDSRYLGPVERSAILYRVTPLFTWGQP